MTRLLLARHGETEWNLTYRFQGGSDIPLNETGLVQAAALAQRLSTEKIDAIYSSDLQRAQQTAAAIQAYHSVPVQTDSRLREAYFGDWEGLTWEQIRQQSPDLMQAWLADQVNVAPPNGESLATVMARVAACVEELRPKQPEGTVLLVAHGGTFQVLMCHLLGLVTIARWQFRFYNASFSELQLFPEGAVLIRHNDTCHL